VLGLLGRHEDAARELEGVPLEGADDRLRYLAALFLGGAREALGQTETAVESFQRAAALYPAAQSPHVALSRLARAAGNHAAAVASLRTILVLPRDDSAREDPWWRYLRPRETESTALLAAWQRSVAGEAGR
jgi:tetratricopeptide (TPR) repeat protein